MSEHFKQLLIDAKDGNPPAIDALKNYSEKNEDFQRSPEPIIEICREKAKKGEPVAQWFLGIWHLGRHTDEDTKEALNWLRSAAEGNIFVHRFEPAICDLAIYEIGEILKRINAKLEKMGVKGETPSSTSGETSFLVEPTKEQQSYRTLPYQKHSLGREITALGESSRLQGIHNRFRNQFAKELFL